MEAKALFAFQSSNQDAEELSFPQGCTLKILDDTDSNWYKAELNGREGYVPANYVQFTKPIWYMSVSKEESADILTMKVGGRARHPDGAFLVRPSQNSPGEMSLTVKLGQDVQHFRILRSQSRDKYYLWSDAPHFNSVNQLVTHYRSASVSKAMPSALLRDLKFTKVRAEYDYQPQMDSEMEIRQGEVIIVLNDSDHDWWEGRLERDGAVSRGFFPSNYVSVISD